MTRSPAGLPRTLREELQAVVGVGKPSRLACRRAHKEIDRRTGLPELSVARDFITLHGWYPRMTGSL
jgi:hypothetical protein